MASLLVRLIKFVFPDAFHLFIRLWKNSLAVVEEDLAVELMLRLLFVPLFHDSTFTGRVLSFLFRLSRVMIGLFAYCLVTVIVLIVALAWYLAPILFFSPSLRLVPILTLGFGLLLFVLELIVYPPKKVKQISSPTELPLTTKLNLAELTWPKIMASPSTQELFFRLEVPAEIFSNLSFDLTSLLEPVYQLATQNQADYLKESYFFVANLDLHPEANNLLLKYQLQTASFHSALAFAQQRDNKHRLAFLWDDDFRVKHLKGVNRGWLAAPTPALNSVSEDLTSQAVFSDIDEFVGRAAALNETIQILSSPHDKNALIVGPAGSGKSTFARYLAKVIVSGDAPAALATKRLVALDIAKLLTGVQTQGDLATKINAFFSEVRYFQNIIVFVDEIQNLGLGQLSNQLNIFGLIEPYLESGDIQFLASTDEAGFERTIEQNSTLLRIFKKVDFPPATPAETVRFLQSLLIKLERQHQTLFTLKAIDEIVDLADKHIHDRVLPDSAITIFDDCLEQISTTRQPVTSETVQQVVSKRSKIPIADTPQTRQELVSLEDRIHQKFIDQAEAVSAITKTLKRAATSLREESRPIGSFLFVGPTGVGKTELAKLLSQTFFEGKGNFFRLDMSEYQTATAVDRLIGSQTTPGILTEQIAHNPYSLILLDEFEKADPKLLTLFLQVLDDGRLTDFSGKTTDFTNTIIIATSNAASVTIAEGLKNNKTLDQLRPSVQYELIQLFKPELINRFDDIILFKPLSSDDLAKIVRIKLTELQQKMQGQGYLIDFSTPLVDELTKRGFDPVLGARPLRRLIQDTLEAKLSDSILQGRINKGDKFVADVDLLA